MSRIKKMHKELKKFLKEHEVRRNGFATMMRNGNIYLPVTGHSYLKTARVHMNPDGAVVCYFA